MLEWLSRCRIEPFSLSLDGVVILPASLTSWHSEHWRHAVTHWCESVEHQVCGGLLHGSDRLAALEAATETNRWDVVHQILQHLPRTEQVTVINEVVRLQGLEGARQLWQIWDSPGLVRQDAWAWAFQRLVTAASPVSNMPQQASVLTRVALEGPSPQTWRNEVGVAMLDMLESVPVTTGLASCPQVLEVLEDHWPLLSHDRWDRSLFNALLEVVTPQWLLPAIARHPVLSLDEPTTLCGLILATAHALNGAMLEALQPTIQAALTERRITSATLGEGLVELCNRPAAPEATQLAFARRWIQLWGKRLPQARVNEAYRTCVGAETQLRELLAPCVRFDRLIPRSREKMFLTPSAAPVLDAMMVHAPSPVRQQWLEKAGVATLPLTAARHLADARRAAAGHGRSEVRPSRPRP